MADECFVCLRGWENQISDYSFMAKALMQEVKYLEKLKILENLSQERSGIFGRAAAVLSRICVYAQSTMGSASPVLQAVTAYQAHSSIQSLLEMWNFQACAMESD